MSVIVSMVVVKNGKVFMKLDWVCCSWFVNGCIGVFCLLCVDVFYVSLCLWVIVVDVVNRCMMFSSIDYISIWILIVMVYFGRC